MTTLNATQSQTYQTLPLANTPFINPDGTITFAWYRVFVSLLQRTGLISPGDAGEAGVSSTQNGVTIGQSPQGAGGPLAAYSAASGALLGIISLVNTAGGPAEPQTVVVSPFTFESVWDGTLIASSGKVEISRDAGVTWYSIGLTGGAVPVLIDDQVRVTWYSSFPPTVVLLPVAVTT